MQQRFDYENRAGAGDYGNHTAFLLLVIDKYCYVVIIMIPG